MRYRSTNLRTKVIALLLSLVALWSFAAWVTLRDGVSLLGVQTIDSQVVAPSEPLLLALQDERRLAVAHLGAGDQSGREALEDSRRKVDGLAATFKTSARSWQAKLASNNRAQQRTETAIAEIDALATVRAATDDRSADRSSTEAAYTRAIESLFQVYDVVGGIDDIEIQADTRNLIDLYRIRELLSRQDGLLAGVLAAGRITPDEHTRFSQLVAAQRFLTDRIVTQLRPEDRENITGILSGADFDRLRGLEDRVVLSDRDTVRPAITAEDWDPAAGAALSSLQEAVLESGDAVVERAAPVAVMVIVRLVLAAGLGLIAVIASVIVSVTTARSLMAQLKRLREAARHLADEQLPTVVERLGRGDKVDVDAEAPPLDFGDDEIGQVGQAFNRVQETAVRTAVEQAELRRAVRDVFLSLARRTQGLVHRQVTLLDAMERQEESPDKLEDLFRIDHLATRMRRNAENLIVLSGAAPGRAWRRNVPMLDVARAATQEVEDYTRVQVLPLGSVGLAGRAVSDVIHLLAELIENALTFSPPQTQVEVKGHLVARGFAVEIEDRGLGMSVEDLAAANEQISNPRDFTLSNANQLGLFVVSQLAARHGIGVQLKASAYGGTTAVVLIPMELVTGAETLTTGRDAGASAPTSDGPAPGGRSRLSTAEPTTETTGGVALAERPARPTTGGRETPPADTARTATGRPGRRSPLSDSAPATQELPMITPARSAQPSTPPRRAEPPARPAGPAADPSAESSRTPAGLPVRVRQASIAPQLRESADTGEITDDAAVVMSPDQVRRTMSSYQHGTRRGRADAERIKDTDSDVPRPDAEEPPAVDTDR
ncbi:sensor histidine kinase [Micromonospora yangpuensis]|nr:nitrate- and nitrite sensing domain-containing protein [Micromonospora yangpuensis]GGM05425.1 ATPase [Micromonospora yangpuensis]